MKKILIMIVALLISQLAHAQQANIPIPVDPRKNPILTGLGFSYFSEAVTLTTTSYVSLLALPVSGSNLDRPWKGIAVRNPSTTRSVYICWGTASGCTQAGMKLGPEVGLVLDDVMFGSQNSVTNIWGKLDSAGSVAPELTIW